MFDTSEHIIQCYLFQIWCEVVNDRLGYVQCFSIHFSEENKYDFVIGCVLELGEPKLEPQIGRPLFTLVGKELYLHYLK